MMVEMVSTYIDQSFNNVSVVTATSPKGAIQRINQDQKFGCIISDFWMGERDGIDLYHEVAPECPNTEFILFTSARRKKFEERLEQTEISKVVRKQNGGFDRLIDSVESIFDKR
ncbi:Response regulator receiver domain protein [Halorhabdus tiamatea SARL4B]|uniref:Response regulator receiver domain protein n=2 Tax=Halorhabdus TaxID=146825 RepID=U2E5B6_9EURY|nr:Response regulator receiver domain protein [Halorhabdus tiamatea SARL4B]